MSCTRLLAIAFAISVVIVAVRAEHVLTLENWSNSRQRAFSDSPDAYARQSHSLRRRGTAGGLLSMCLAVALIQKCQAASSGALPATGLRGSNICISILATRLSASILPITS